MGSMFLAVEVYPPLVGDEPNPGLLALLSAVGRVLRGLLLFAEGLSELELRSAELPSLG